MVWFYHAVDVYRRRRRSNDFQSHYGLILSLKKLRPLTNSKKSFNPTMVWFYRFIKSSFLRAISSFQSHYGLILSQSAKDAVSVGRIPFNPTMVWFYQRERDNRRYNFKTAFQSHYGLILSQGTSPWAAGLVLPFNPTMVWFYPGVKRHQRTDFSCFQSHYGLILSRKDIQQHVPLRSLSIPLWSDFINR